MHRPDGKTIGEVTREPGSNSGCVMSEEDSSCVVGAEEQEWAAEERW